MDFYRLDDLEFKTMAPGFHGTFIHSDNVTVARWKIDQGATLPDHAHPHEQITMVMAGTFEMRVGGETRKLVAGDMVVIPGHVPHSGTALTDCRVTDVFHPTREDYRFARVDTD